MDNKIKCIVVDDEAVSRMVLEKYIAQTDLLRLVASCESAIDAIKVLQEDKIDIIFCDIEMPGLSGMDLIKSLKTAPCVVLITGKPEYAAEAFEFDVTDYIVKPVAYPRFLKSVNKAVEFLNTKMPAREKASDKLFIKVDQKFISISLNEILYIEAQKDYVKIVTETNKYLTLSTMKGVEAKLPTNEFIRIHRSYIVRIDKISDLRPENLLIGKEILPIGESYKEDLFKRINIL